MCEYIQVLSVYIYFFVFISWHFCFYLFKVVKILVLPPQLFHTDIYVCVLVLLKLSKSMFSVIIPLPWRCACHPSHWRKQWAQWRTLSSPELCLHTPTWPLHWCHSGWTPAHDSAAPDWSVGKEDRHYGVSPGVRRWSKIKLEKRWRSKHFKAEEEKGNSKG